MKLKFKEGDLVIHLFYNNRMLGVVLGSSVCDFLDNSVIVFFPNKGITELSEGYLKLISR